MRKFLQRHCASAYTFHRRRRAKDSCGNVPLGRPGYSFGNECYNSLVNSGQQLVRPEQAPERNWLPMAVACAIVLAVLGGLLLIFGHGSNQPAVTPTSASADPYAANLQIGKLEMSESSTMSGGKITYLDGHIVNQGKRVVNGITVQVLFRNVAHEVVQNETQPLTFIRTRDPYIDIEPVSAAPLKSGDAHDFRLIFDTVSNDWDGSYTEIRILHVAYQ
jgi:hypothetical protein